MNRLCAVFATLAFVSFTGCQYDRWAHGFATRQPAERDVVGLYTVDPASLQRTIKQNSKNTRIKKRLLEDLFYVELYLGRLAAGLRTLEQRRALGYSKPEQRMDAALHAATLLARQNKAEQAMDELLGLISDPKLLKWHGVLKTLSLYVEVENECRKSVDHALNKASVAAIRKFGIRLDHGDEKHDVRE